MASVSTIRFRRHLANPIPAPYGQKRLFLGSDGVFKTIDDQGNVEKLAAGATDVDPAYPDVPQIPLWRSDITALTGGTPDALDSLPTAGGLYDGRIVIVATPFAIYQLIDGDDAEDAPGIIRPDDFAVSTNEKVWIQRL